MAKKPQDGKNIYQCDECEYVYNPAHHQGKDLDEQDTWECPVCQAGRSHFHLVTPPDDDLVENVEDGEEEDEEDVVSPFDRSIYQQTSSPYVSSLKKKYDRGNLDPQPDFQRYEVWSTKKNSRLIESILLDLPLPLIYLAEENKGPTVVIDGQQRLMAIFRFLNDEYKLVGLGPLKELNGQKFKDLDEELQQRIEDFSLSVVEIKKESEEGIKFDLFERLNTGTTSLNDQELRNSVFRGRYNEFLKDLAETPDLRKLLNLKEPHKRMVDVEYVLRFMTFRDQTYLKHDDKNTGKFLNRTMKSGKLLWENEADEAEKKKKKDEKAFKVALANALTVFGNRAFRRFVPGNEDNPNGAWESRVNKALMDVQLQSFARYPRGVITKNSDAIRDLAVELMGENEEFADLIRHTISEKKRVIRRFRIWDDAIDGLLEKEQLGPRAFSVRTRKALFARDPTCAECGQGISLLEDAHVDHKVAYAKGGPTRDDNAQLTHRWCNMAKGAT